ncbi:hypothetical protein ES332_A03G178600v1 [Gossypium tomentosum]|uniref:Uncharacterized protein n=1 Tax=Gossypium tomentosum TaxID=34277 RepID=A0A5D2RAX1_GOSTO|nr:hypothetical protein ES332_A03G178600v1 [Gossypium tomentosum]
MKGMGGVGKNCALKKHKPAHTPHTYYSQHHCLPFPLPAFYSLNPKYLLDERHKEQREAAQMFGMGGAGKINFIAYIITNTIYGKEEGSVLPTHPSPKTSITRLYPSLSHRIGEQGLWH